MNLNNGVLDGVRRIGQKIRELTIDGGIPGAPLGLRIRGATVSGPPVSGTWKAGDHVEDRTGAIWICATGGTPGTWIQSGISAVAAREVYPDLRSLGQGYRTSVKLRGICTTPPVSAAGSWATYWGSGFSYSYIQSQLAYARQIGCNAVSVYGNLTNVIGGTQTMVSYLGNIAQYLTYAASLGLMVHHTIEGSVLANLAYPSYFAQVAAFLNAYPNVVSIDVANEIQAAGSTTAPTSTQISQVQAASAAIRAVTAIPLTYSMLCGGSAALTSAGALSWLSLIAANADFFSFHPYYADPANMALSTVQGVNAAYPSMPVMLGEVGDIGNTTNQYLGARFEALRPIVEQPYVTGLFGFSLNDYNSSDQFGLFDADWNERTFTTWPFRTLPKRQVYQSETMPLVTPANAVSLTASLATVTNSDMLIQTTAADSGIGDPQFRVACEFTGLNYGDTVEAQVIDADAGTLYGTLVTATPAWAGSTPDASQSSNPVFMVGSGITNPASPTSGFGNVISFTSGNYGIIPVINQPGLQACIGGTQAWAVECMFIRTRTGVQETLTGCWGGIGSAGFESWLLYINSSNKLSAAAYTGSGSVFPTGGTAITDTNEHYAALTYDGTNLRLFLDGTLISTNAAAAVVSMESASVAGWQPILVGIQGGATLADPFAGSVEEIRVSNVVRHTATYTPAASPFTTDSNTYALYHGDSIPSNVVTRVETPWTYVQPGPNTAVLQVANTTGARGSLVSAAKQIRYSG